MDQQPDPAAIAADLDAPASLGDGAASPLPELGRPAIAEALETVAARLAAVERVQREALATMQQPAREYLNAAEAADFLRIGKRTLEDLVAEGIVRPIRPRPKVRLFAVAHLRAVMDAHTR